LGSPTVEGVRPSAMPRSSGPPVLRPRPRTGGLNFVAVPLVEGDELLRRERVPSADGQRGPRAEIARGLVGRRLLCGVARRSSAERRRPVRRRVNVRPHSERREGHERDRERQGDDHVVLAGDPCLDPRDARRESGYACAQRMDARAQPRDALVGPEDSRVQRREARAEPAWACPDWLATPPEPRCSAAERRHARAKRPDAHVKPPSARVERPCARAEPRDVHAEPIEARTDPQGSRRERRDARSKPTGARPEPMLPRAESCEDRGQRHTLDPHDRGSAGNDC
jgi:hypothetical protein